MDMPPEPSAGPERLVAPRPAPPVTPAEVARRLEAVENNLADLGARLEALASAVPAAVQASVAAEVQAASGELRHTVAELGRLLVRDLGKLSQILGQHRDVILDELRGLAPSSPPAPPSPSAADGSAPAPAPGDDEQDLPPDVLAVSDGPGGVEDDDAGTAEGGDGEAGERSWRRRRRSS